MNKRYLIMGYHWRLRRMEKEGKMDAREAREGKSERLGQFKRKEKRAT